MPFNGKIPWASNIRLMRASTVCPTAMLSPTSSDGLGVLIIPTASIGIFALTALNGLPFMSVVFMDPLPT